MSEFQLQSRFSISTQWHKTQHTEGLSGNSSWEKKTNKSSIHRSINQFQLSEVRVKLWRWGCREDGVRCFRYTDEGKVLIGLQFVKKINSLVHKVSVFTWHLHVMLFLHKLVLRGHFFKLQETPACYQRHSLWSPDRALIIWRTTVPQIKLYICKWRYEHWLYILYISIKKKKIHCVVSHKHKTVIERLSLCGSEFTKYK